jgi:hypothetical protein
MINTYTKKVKIPLISHFLRIRDFSSYPVYFVPFFVQTILDLTAISKMFIRFARTLWEKIKYA